ncbi:MAG: CPBP family glutamic-type intramembrane protease [Planctomycetota bacterium]|nr:CPBP family glutamic-type intramembrane protease [Planctomycetota bacterium]
MRARITELILLFGVLPVALLVLRSSGIRVSPLPVLWLAAAGCVVLLWRMGRISDPNRESSVNARTRRSVMAEVVITIVIGSALLLLLYPLISDEPMARFPRERPGLWLVVLVVYPMLSVVPQGIIFRRWFVARYRPLLGSGAMMILVGAACFGWSHLLFGNPVAPLITAVGGIFFLRTYLRGGSGWLSDLQHAVLGDVAFTIGYGQWLYAGAVN